MGIPPLRAPQKPESNNWYMTVVGTDDLGRTVTYEGFIKDPQVRKTRDLIDLERMSSPVFPADFRSYDSQKYYFTFDTDIEHGHAYTMTIAPVEVDKSLVVHLPDFWNRSREARHKLAEQLGVPIGSAYIARRIGDDKIEFTWKEKMYLHG